MNKFRIEIIFASYIDKKEEQLLGLYILAGIAVLIFNFQGIPNQKNIFQEKIKN